MQNAFTVDHAYIQTKGHMEGERDWNLVGQIDEQTWLINSQPYVKTD